MNPKIDLFTPFDLGSLTLPNRIVMAPMTRSRAGSGLKKIPTTLNATYYAQRASAGLIITDSATFYAAPCDDSVENCGFEKGYTDYPFLTDSASA